jgi:hypothetical protein
VAFFVVIMLMPMFLTDDFFVAWRNCSIQILLSGKTGQPQKYFVQFINFKYESWLTMLDYSLEHND